MPKGVGITEIRNRKEGLDQFLNPKHKQVDIDSLKQQYFNASATINKENMDGESLEKYIKAQN